MAVRLASASMPHWLPPLQTLRAFQAAAETRSFTAAGEALNISQSAVSQQVQLLEGALRTPLFVRRPRGLALTDAGEVFAAAVSEALALISEAAVRARGASPSQGLSIAVIPSLGSRWLVPRLTAFRSACPGIDLSILPAFEPEEIEKSGAAFGLLYGSGRWRGWASEHLYRESVFPVCAPELLKGRTLRTADEIFEFTLLRDADPRHEYWPAWLARAGGAKRMVHQGPKFDSQADMIAAALDGQGIALVRSLLVEDDLRAGRLAKPLDIEIPARFAYHLVWSRTDRPSPTAEVVADWLRQQLSAAQHGKHLSTET